MRSHDGHRDLCLLRGGSRFARRPGPKLDRPAWRGTTDVPDLGRGLWAVVSEVPLSTYGPAEVEAGLRNLEWVAEIAVAHEAVVEHFATRRGATVVPMKLFTMFTSFDRAISGFALEEAAR